MRKKHGCHQKQCCSHPSRRTNLFGWLIMLQDLNAATKGSVAPVRPVKNCSFAHWPKGLGNKRLTSWDLYLKIDQTVKTNRSKWSKGRFALNNSWRVLGWRLMRPPPAPARPPHAAAAGSPSGPAPAGGSRTSDLIAHTSPMVQW